MKLSKLLTLICVSPFLSVGCTQSSSQTIVLPGIVETQEVRLSSKVGGRVLKVLVKEGEIVEYGRLLVTLDSAELEAKRAQLIAQQELFQAKLDMMSNGPLPEQIDAAKAALEMSEARLQKMQAGWRREEVDMAKYGAEMWTAESERASAEYARLQSVKGTNTISLTELDAAKAAMLRTISQANSSAKYLEMLINGTRVEDVSEAKAAVAKMKSDYDLVKRGTRDEELRQAKAQVAEVIARICELDAQLAECSILAPDRCLVEVVGVRHGDLAAPNVPVIRVLYEGDRWIKAYIPETQLAFIKLNQQVVVTHDGSSREYEGAISHIANISEFTPRNVQSPDERHHQVFGIKVLVKDAAGVFKSGMAASIRVQRTK